MFELFAVVIFVYLMTKAIGLAFRLTWGVSKIIASILIGLAVPVLMVCMLFVGGIALLVPIVVIGIAVGILKSSV